MIEKPLVSVITPTYNSERFIKDTIESVINQTYDNWEMIIVDDASTDRTVEIIKHYQKKDFRIKLIVLKENSGSAIARNTAMDNAKGKFLAFLDSDDMWIYNKLEKQVKFMLNNDLAFSYTKYQRILEDGTKTNEISQAPIQVKYDDLMKHCVIGCLTVMIDKEKIGNERMVNIRTRQDYVYWLTLTKKGYYAYGLPEVLAKYRLVKNSISRNKWKAAKKNWEVYYKIENKTFFKSLWYFLNYTFINLKKIISFKLKR